MPALFPRLSETHLIEFWWSFERVKCGLKLHICWWMFFCSPRRSRDILFRVHVANFRTGKADEHISSLFSLYLFQANLSRQQQKPTFLEPAKKSSAETFRLGMGGTKKCLLSRKGLKTCSKPSTLQGLIYLHLATRCLICFMSEALKWANSKVEMKLDQPFTAGPNWMER